MASAMWVVFGLFTFCVLFATSFAAYENKDVLARLSSVETKISLMEREKEDFQSKNNELREENTYLKARISYLEANFRFHKEEFSIIKKRLTKAEHQISLFNNLEFSQDAVKNSYQEEEVSRDIGTSSDDSTAERNSGREPTLSDDLLELHPQPKPRIKVETVDLNTLDEKSERLKSRGNSRRLLTHLPLVNTAFRISFSAHMGSAMASLGANQAFTFDVVNNNEGGSYDKLSGMFTCPVDGTYFFTVTIESEYNEELWGEMVVNNVPKSHIGADGRNGAYGSGTNSLIIHCNKGQDVWVRRYGANGKTNIHGNRYSHFGGFLLWNDSI